MSKSSRGYNFFMLTYADPKPLLEIKYQKGVVVAYACIRHQAEGEDLKDHYHSLVRTRSAATAEQISGWTAEYLLPVGESIFCQKCLNPKASFDYLTHKNSPDKRQYGLEDIVGRKMDVFFDEAKNARMVDAVGLAAHGMLMDAVKMGGRDFVIHYGHIRKLIWDLQGIKKGQENDIDTEI